MIAAGCLAAISAAESVRDDLGVDVELADPASDELCVLRAEVDDEHGRTGGAVVLGRRFVAGGATEKATDGRQAVCPSWKSAPASSPASR